MRAATTVRQAVVLAGMNWRTSMRELGLLVGFLVVFPLGFLFFLGHLVTPGSRVQVLAGSVMMEMALININVLAQSIGQDKESRLYDLYVSLPMSPLAYVVSAAVSLLPFSLLSAGLTLAVGQLWFGLPSFSIPAVLGGLLLVWASTLGIGFVLAVYGSSPRQISGNAQFVGVVMTFLAPVFYPVGVLPALLRPVAYLWPLTWGALLLRAIVAGDAGSILPAAAVLAGFAIGGAVLIGIGLRWRER